jgi:hypothetical protein
MARPKAKELTERELEVMHVFWDRGESTAAEVRDVLETQGRDLAYTTVATLVKILHDKQFLTQTSDERPFRFRPARTYEEVSSSTARGPGAEGLWGLAGELAGEAVRGGEALRRREEAAEADSGRRRSQVASGSTGTRERPVSHQGKAAGSIHQPLGASPRFPATLARA